MKLFFKKKERKRKGKEKVMKLGEIHVGEKTGNWKREMEGRDDQIVYMCEILKNNEKYFGK